MKASDEYWFIKSELVKLGSFNDENYETQLASLEGDLATQQKLYKAMDLGSAEEEQMITAGKKLIKKTATGFKLRQKFKDCGLTDTEIYAIAYYSSLGYNSMNQALRSKVTDNLANVAGLIMAVNSGLQKLAPYKGQVKRGASLPKEILAEHIPGNVVTYKAFTSASTKLGFTYPAHHFIIEGKTGRYIAPLSFSIDEEEVLFPSGTKFKILSRENLNDGEVNFTMVEVD